MTPPSDTPPAGPTRLQHGSCAALDGTGVLLLGPPGAGKSDLLLRLIGVGWQLVADDQVELSLCGGALRAAAPAALRGMIEVRGLGLLGGLEAEPAPLGLAVDCVARAAVPRLPEPRSWEALGAALPLVALHPLDASAPDKLGVALRALRGALHCSAGAFASA